MIKHNALTILLITIFSLGLSAQSWESENKNGFIDSCVGEASSAMGENGAIQYCACMLDKIMNVYSDPGEADNMTTDEIMPMATECVETLGVWEDPIKNEFLKSCIDTGKEDLGEERATTYCNCMLNKLSVLFPDPDKYEMTEGELQALAATCLY